MPRSERARRLVKVAPWTALLLGIGCGGGDKGPTGPGGGEAPVSYELASLGRVGLPADAQLEDCSLTRFYSGGLQLTDDGSWQISLQVHDYSGDWGYLDEGEIEEDGAAVRFDSGVSGASYQGEVDGSEVKIMYDWCYNGVPDVQLVFDR
jgi:hypothetical protein